MKKISKLDIVLAAFVLATAQLLVGALIVELIALLLHCN